jgi:hypothetical protein
MNQIELELEDGFIMDPESRLEEVVLQSIVNPDRDWIDQSVHELRHFLVDSGICSMELKLVLEKVKDDLNANLRAVHNSYVLNEEFERLTRQEQFKQIAPRYLVQLLDEELNLELIALWIEGMLQGKMPLPGQLPKILGQAISKKDPIWADNYLDPKTEQGDLHLNASLRYEVFKRTGLI